MQSTTRRRLLKLGLGGGVLLGIGGVWAFFDSSDELPLEVKRSLRVLSPREYLVIQAISKRLFREGDSSSPRSPFPDPVVVDVGARVDAFLRSLEAQDQRDFKRLLQLCEHLFPWLAGHFGRFTKLSGDAQDAVLRAMERSSFGVLRGAFQVVKSVCALAYFSSPATWAAIGYDGPLVNRPAGGWT
ncbi:MAG: gluconate 2-dehydrogenase subunit 3 family protein, partial [Deltaproteobacteria bacterium]|nr:gluconate 2-dehydrogenase subunit 3 family protein [Deltaproteobacteria bacterium]